jgi:hypothetical protein
MPVKHSRHIKPADARAAWIDGQVVSGGYVPTFDLVHAAIRMPKVRTDEAIPAHGLDRGAPMNHARPRT